jgi:hypothetical protein
VPVVCIRSRLEKRTCKVRDKLDCQDRGERGRSGRGPKVQREGLHDGLSSRFRLVFLGREREGETLSPPLKRLGGLHG